MKTKKNIFRKMIQLTILSMLVSFIQSCETEIPITDTVDPEFTFQISGDGFNRTFDQDFDFSSFQLNLRDDTVYQYTYTGSDSGGVDLIQWQADTRGVVIFETSIESPWTVRDISALSRMIQWRGDRNNPLTGSVVTGRFRTNGQLASILFRFFVRDFGGEPHIPNSSSGALGIYIGNHATEIKPL